MKLTLAFLYATTMNIYGDRGNVLALQRRCQWRGIELVVVPVGLGDPIEPGRFDLFFFGGGQDKEQVAVAADLQGPKGQALKAEIDAGAPALAVCGGYQLLGHYYQPAGAPRLPGIGVFDVISEAGSERFIGNVIVDSDEFGTLVGFENHSGRTRLGAGVRPLGRVRVGRGNNGQDGTEGARYRNAIGCYLHGSFLPKNPAVADYLIAAAIERRYGPRPLPPLDDRLEAAAHASALDRAARTR
jgi:CobQ-like glutamine amidotransferase family enzyme